MRLPRPHFDKYTRNGKVAWLVALTCFAVLAVVEVASFWWNSDRLEVPVAVLGLVYWGSVGVAFFFRAEREKPCVASVTNLAETVMYRFPENVAWPDGDRPTMMITWINPHHVVVSFPGGDWPIDGAIERIQKLTEVEAEVFGAETTKRRALKPGLAGA